ncbi:hypothetical protein P171DRAFT_427377 [Karstenula rhodostoma CBS 690.94]|uniref:Uncharacterized protein n=1 Tax=Karstenula rhodostoma CBS 690.94 TaxID=1392251 RepID=A0A9P4PPU1_9PLEO|nr:hypothetical protein P171DRAFT_427377 [Karstenula rhodostoma CBS 690.94]
MVKRTEYRGDRSRLRAAISAANVDTIVEAFLEAENKAAALQDCFDEINTKWRKEKEKRKNGDAKIKDLNIRFNLKFRDWLEADGDRELFQLQIKELCQVIQMGARASHKCEWINEAIEFIYARDLPMPFLTRPKCPKEEDDDGDEESIALSEIETGSEGDENERPHGV